MDKITALQQTLDQIAQLKSKVEEQRNEINKSAQGLQIDSINQQDLVYGFHISNFNKCNQPPSQAVPVIKYITTDGQQIICPIDKIRAMLGPYLQPASYGDTLQQQTKIDPKVRNSLKLERVELLLDQDGLSNTSKLDGQSSTDNNSNNSDLDDNSNLDNNSSSSNNNCKNKLDIYQVLNNKLQSFLSYRKVKFIPHALNVYPPLGHFNKHVDTPRHDQARMIGTVVVVVQSEDSHNYLNSVFFFGDVVHEVKPNSGIKDRITFTYDVVLEQDEVIPWTPNPKLNKLLLNNINKIIIFCLRNKYTVEALKQGVMKCEHDVQLYQQLLNTGKKIQLEHIFINAEQNRAKIFDPYNSSDNSIDFNENMDSVDEFGNYPEYVQELSQDKLKLIQPNFDTDHEVIIVEPFNCPIDLMNETSTATETSIYTGNQYDDGIKMICNRVYNSAAIILHNY